jgi:hypothetical protein
MCKDEQNMAQSCHSFRDGVLEIETGSGEKLRFSFVSKRSLAIRAWWRRLRLDYCTVNALDPETAIALIDLLTFVLDDEQRTTECLLLAYPGNHAGINWYHDIDPAPVEEALAHFFVSCFTTAAVKTNASQAYSLPAATGLKEAMN